MESEVLNETNSLEIEFSLMEKNNLWAATYLVRIEYYIFIGSLMVKLYVLLSEFSIMLHKSYVRSFLVRIIRFVKRYGCLFLPSQCWYYVCFGCEDVKYTDTSFE